MGLGGVVIQFFAKTGEATRDINKVTFALDKVDGATKKTSGAMGKMGKAVAGVGLGVGALAVGGVAVFVDMAKGAFDAARAQAKLEKTLSRVPGVTKKAARSTEDWVDQMRLATLVSGDDLRQGVADLTLATGDMGKAQKLALLAWDLSVQSGKEYGEVLEAMTEASKGDAGALKEQAQWLKTGKDGTLTFASAMEQLEEHTAGAAKAAADNDVFGRLGVAWDLISKAIGSAALPTLEAVSAWFGDKANVDKIQGWIDQIRGWATEVGEEFKGKIQDFLEWLKSPEGQQRIKDFADSIKTIANALIAVADAFKKAKGFIDWLMGNGPQSAATVPFQLQGKTITPYLPQGSGSNDVGSGYGRQSSSNGNSTVVNIYNPKPERATTSVASSLRVERPQGVWV